MGLPVDGSFQAPAAILTLDDPYSGSGGALFSASHRIVAGDADGDGRTDLVVSSVFVWSGFSYSSSLWLGDGAGGFLPGASVPGGRAVQLIDVDRDGRDEVLYDYQGKLRDAGILRREADGRWSSLALWTTSDVVRLGELDRDPARLEVLVADTGLVSGLRQDVRNRSNLAIVVQDLTPPSRFRVELFDGRTGTLARTIEGIEAGIHYGAPSRIQLDSVLWETGVPFGWARVVQTTGWSPFFACAVVHDGATPGLGSGDGTYLPGISR